MIARIWHGWTTPALADTYEELLKTEIFPSIFEKRIPGFRKIELLRRELGHETEFATVMWFDGPAAVTAFVDEDHGVAYVPARARRVLARFDECASHYEVRADHDAPPAA